MKKIILITILLSLSSAFLSAQDTLQKSVKGAPVLNGHTFPSIIAIRSPFIKTSFQANIGIGQTSRLTVPGINIGDYELITFEGKLLFVNLGINYQQRFNDWLSLYISAKIAARLGVDMSTILVDGVNTMTGGEIGWLIKIYQGKKISLAGSLGLRNMTGSFINVKDYFEEIINNNPDPSVTKVVPAMSAGGGLHFAWAISPTFGMQVSSSYAYGESFVRDENEGYLNSGIAFDADFNPAKHIPVGITLGYVISNIPEIMLNYKGPTNLAVAMLYYTGSDDFELGLQYNLNDLTSDHFKGTARVSTTSIVFKYYF